MTSEGIRSRPLLDEILSVFNGEEVANEYKKSGNHLQYPVLLISTGCLFSRPAKNFWSKIADEIRMDLHVIDVEQEPGIEQEYGVAGFPCLVMSPTEHHYGMHYSHEEAKNILLQL